MKWNVGALIVIAAPEHSVLIDITISMDVSSNPGPEMYEQKVGMRELLKQIQNHLKSMILKNKISTYLQVITLLKICTSSILLLT